MNKSIFLWSSFTLIMVLGVINCHNLILDRNMDKLSPTGNSDTGNSEPLVASVETTEPTTTEKIIELSKEHNFDTETALRIAECESQLGKYQVNWEGSSAKGVYMFMPKTFNAYCDGNIDIEEDQIICFIKLYPKHPEWWKCK